MIARTSSRDARSGSGRAGAPAPVDDDDDEGGGAPNELLMLEAVDGAQRGCSGC